MQERPRNDDDGRSALRARAMRAGIGLGVLALFAYAVFGAQGLLEQYGRYHRHAALEQQLAGERALNEALRRDIEALRTTDLAIERAARTELDYRRPGEVVFVVEGADQAGAGALFDSPPASP